MNALRALALTGAAALAAAASVLAFLPQGVVPSDLGTGIGDKPAHGCFAGLLAALLIAGLPADATAARRGRAVRRRRRAAAGAVVALVTASSIAVEAAQPLFGRGAELGDVLANVAGASAVLALVLVAPRGGSSVRSVVVSGRERGSSREIARGQDDPLHPRSAVRRADPPSLERWSAPCGNVQA